MPRFHQRSPSVTGENAHAYDGDIIFKRVAPPRYVFSND
jgi:hypothetical protein